MLRFRALRLFRPSALILSGAILCSGGAGAQVVGMDDEIAAKINAWFTAGEAAGLEALHYENRDGAHSPMVQSHYPQVKFFEHSEAAKAQGQNTGPAGTTRDMPIFGNSSMASNHDAAGCIPRMYSRLPGGFRFLQSQYLASNLFVYPEHKDHDPGVNGVGGYGDLLPYNSPYLVISQGSSYSDRPFLHAVFKATAAMRPEVQAKLIESGLFVPTLQQLLRRSYGTNPAAEDAYFLPETHPTVFNAELLDVGRMVDLAHALAIEDIPPLARIEMEKEETPVKGRDYFEPDTVWSEKIGDDTLGLIARVYRSSAPVRDYRLGASKSADPLRRPLTYRWELVRGDPAKVRITPSSDGKTADIQIAHHHRFMAPDGITPTHRVDIALFVSNGRAWSAPAFFSLNCLPRETRIYDEHGRLIEIDYASRNRKVVIPPMKAETFAMLLREFEPGQDGIASRVIREAVAPEHRTGLGELSSRVAPFVARAAGMNAQIHEVANAARQRAGDAAIALRAITEKPEAERAAGALEAATRAKADADAANIAAQVEIAELTAAKEAEEAAAIALATEEIAPGLRAGDTLAAAFQVMLQDITLYPRHSAAIDALNNHPAKEVRSDLIHMGVVTEAAGGGVTLVNASHVPPNDVHHLLLANAVILRHTLFPGSINQGGEPNWGATTFSTPKNWRDVYLYDAAGAAAGWIRWAGGKATRYTADGRFVTAEAPDGRPTATGPVSYSVRPGTQDLTITPQTR